MEIDKFEIQKLKIKCIVSSRIFIHRLGVSEYLACSINRHLYIYNVKTIISNKCCFLNFLFIVFTSVFNADNSCFLSSKSAYYNDS